MKLHTALSKYQLLVPKSPYMFEKKLKRNGGIRLWIGTSTADWDYYEIKKVISSSQSKLLQQGRESSLEP